jgi:hypothetical protein
MADDQDAGAKLASASSRTPTCAEEPLRPVPDGVSPFQDDVVFRAPDEEQVANRRDPSRLRLELRRQWSIWGSRWWAMR